MIAENYSVILFAVDLDLTLVLVEKPWFESFPWPVCVRASSGTVQQIIPDWKLYYTIDSGFFHQQVREWFSNESGASERDTKKKWWKLWKKGRLFGFIIIRHYLKKTLFNCAEHLGCTHTPCTTWIQNLLEPHVLSIIPALRQERTLLELIDLVSGFCSMLVHILYIILLSVVYNGIYRLGNLVYFIEISDIMNFS